MSVKLLVELSLYDFLTLSFKQSESPNNKRTVELLTIQFQ